MPMGIFTVKIKDIQKGSCFSGLNPHRVNIPWAGSLEEPATSSQSSEYLPDALKWMDPAHCEIGRASCMYS